MTEPEPKKSMALKECVRHQMEHSGNWSTAPHGQHHVTELRNGAVGQTLFQIHLGEGDGGPKEAGDRANNRNHSLNNWKLGVERIQSRDQEHPCRHHGCGVNKSRDRSGSLHGIR